METLGDLPAEFFSANRARLRALFGGTAPIVVTGNSLVQKSADGTYPFAQDSSFWYLTGLSEPNLVLVLDGSKEYIIAPEEDPVRSLFDGARDREALARRSGVTQWYDRGDGWDRLSRRVKKVKHVATLQPAPAYIASIGMYTNPARANLVARLKAAKPDVDLIDLRGQLAAMRVVKQSQELEMMQRAIKQTAEMFRVVEKKRAKALHEYELMAELEHWRIQNQAEYAYDPIIASGRNGLTLHYQSNDGPLDEAGFLLLDIGAKVGGYCADITRTVAESPTKRQQAVYDGVLAIHEFACSLLKAGANLNTYEEAVAQYAGEKLRELGLIRTISKETVREFYPHATSHFLGIDTHDVGDHDAPLVAGAVLTVEPGIYIAQEGIAIRLEDNVLITDDGIVNLSDHIPKHADSLT